MNEFDRSVRLLLREAALLRRFPGRLFFEESVLAFATAMSKRRVAALAMVMSSANARLGPFMLFVSSSKSAFVKQPRILVKFSPHYDMCT